MAKGKEDIQGSLTAIDQGQDVLGNQYGQEQNAWLTLRDQLARTKIPFLGIYPGTKLLTLRINDEFSECLQFGGELTRRKIDKLARRVYGDNNHSVTRFSPGKVRLVTKRPDGQIDIQTLSTVKGTEIEWISKSGTNQDWQEAVAAKIHEIKLLIPVYQ